MGSKSEVLRRSRFPGARRTDSIPAAPRADLGSGDPGGRQIRFAGSHPAKAAAPNPAVCVISPFKRSYGPTFIVDLIDSLPARISALYGNHGDYLPRWTANDRPLLSAQPLPRMKRAVWRRLWGLPDDYHDRVALRRFLVASRSETVLAQFGPTGVAVLETCEDLGLPLIVHFRGYDVYSRSVLELYGEGYRQLFARAAAIVAVSRAMQDQLSSLGAPRERLHYVSSGVDPVLFQGGRPAETPASFIAVGRFVDKKAPFLSILAFAKIAADIPDARLTMVGGGALLETCRRLVEVYGLRERVTFTGVLPHAEVAERLRAARAFVQHSVQTSDGDAEGTPNAVMEASATGIPVIATRHMGIGEAVLDGITGFLVNEGDVDGMAAAMRRIASDAGLAARLGEAGRRHMISSFRRSDCLEKLMGLVREAAAKRRETRVSPTT